MKMTKQRPTSKTGFRPQFKKGLPQDIKEEMLAFLKGGEIR
jgi:hypothetical protein